MSQTTIITRRLGRVFTVLTVVCIVLAAYGGATGTSGVSLTSFQSRSVPTTSPSVLAAANQLVNKLLDPAKISFPRPTKPVTVRAQSVTVIAAGLSGEGASTVAAFLKQAVKAIGWKSGAIGDGEFDPSTEAGLIRRAVQAHTQGILLAAIDPGSVATAIAQALAAKVPVVCAQCGPPSTTPGTKGVLYVGPSSVNSGKAVASYIIAKSNGKAKVWAFEDAEFADALLHVQTAVKTLRTCAGCTVHTQNMTVAQATAPGAPYLTAFLSSHPAGTVNWIITPYDTAASPFATAAAQQGRSNVNFTGNACETSFVQQIQAGSPPGAAGTSCSPIPYESWAGVDLMARAFAKVPTWNANSLPVALVDKGNAADFTHNGYFSPPFNFRAYFERLWKHS
jgi:ribose transport system substrate-binding protein